MFRGIHHSLLPSILIPLLILSFSSFLLLILPILSHFLLTPFCSPLLLFLSSFRLSPLRSLTLSLTLLHLLVIPFSFPIRCKVTYRDFAENYGGGFLDKYYQSSPFRLLSAHFPTERFYPWLFASVPGRFFSSKENRKSYVDWLIETVGAASPSELKATDFMNHGGLSLLQKFRGSPTAVLASLEPDPNSLEKGKGGGGGEGCREGQEKGGRLKPRHYWTSMENQRAFLDDLAVTLGFPPLPSPSPSSSSSPYHSITSSTTSTTTSTSTSLQKRDLSHWYTVSSLDIARHGGNGILKVRPLPFFCLLSAFFLLFHISFSSSFPFLLFLAIQWCRFSDAREGVSRD